MKLTIRLCPVALFVASLMAHAAAANLVTNGSFEHTFTASSNVTALTFFGYNDDSYLPFDNVSVPPTPEPSAAALMFAGILVTVLLFRPHIFACRPNE